MSGHRRLSSSVRDDERRNRYLDSKGESMKYRYLGRRGMKVSELCLGAMTFGRELDPSDSHRVLDRFVDSGGTFIDTANV